MSLTSSTIKNVRYESTANSKDIITLQENTMLSKASSFNLGKLTDQITFHGELKKTYVDLGDDKAVDKVALDSLDQIVKKKLIISNFSKKDELIIGGETFTHDDLQEIDFDPIKVITKGGDVLA